MVNDSMVGKKQSHIVRFLAPALVTLFLAACVPAETGPDQASAVAGLNSGPDETATPAETFAPDAQVLTEAMSPEVQPEMAELDWLTATPLPTLELMPTSPAKPAPTQEVARMPENPPAPPPDDPQLQKLIDKAKTDLSQRTDVPVEEIVLYEFQLMTWPDASLGCPQPGMAYAQVTQDGYLIMLQAGQVIYNYHGGGYPDRGPFLCEGIGSKIIPPPPRSVDQ